MAEVFNIDRDPENFDEEQVVVAKGSTADGIEVRTRANCRPVVVGQNPVVKGGSVIVAINGKTRDLDLRKALKNTPAGGHLVIQVQRLKAFTAIAEMKRILGIDISPGTAIVHSMAAATRHPADDMSFYAWNDTCPEGHEILTGDIIASVNGVATPERNALVYEIARAANAAREGRHIVEVKFNRP